MVQGPTCGEGRTMSHSTTVNLVEERSNADGVGQSARSSGAGRAAARVDNREQSIQIRGPYDIHCGVLDNGKGKIVIDGPLSIICDTLINCGGVIVASGPIKVQCSKFINLRGDIKSHEGTLVVIAELRLLNQRGTLLAKGDLTLDSPQQLLNNSRGSITSTGKLLVNVGVLRNGEGTLQAQGSVAIKLDRGPISGEGTICAGKELCVSVEGGDPTKLEGELSATENIKLTSPGTLEHFGKVNGKNVLVTSHTFQNRGKVEGEQISFKVDQLENCRSVDCKSAQPPAITAHGHLAISATTVRNLNEAQLLSDDSLAINSRLNGYQGAEGTRCVLDNCGGTIAAIGAARLNVTCFGGGEGSALQGGDVILETGSLLGASALSATKDLRLILKGEEPAYLEGTLKANGRVQVDASGALTNRSDVEAGVQLTLTAHAIHNDATGSLRSNGETLITTGNGEISNHGAIDGICTKIRGDSISNVKSGTASGDQLLLEAETLQNDGRGRESTEITATFSARKKLLIAGQHLSNVGGALITSEGVLVVGASLDDKGQVEGPMRLLDNQGSRITAGGPLTVETVTFNHDDASTLRAEAHLTLKSDTLNGGGSISSGSKLEVHLRDPQPVILRGPLQARTMLSVSAPGELNNHNSWEAKAELDVRCQFLRNHAEGSIRSEGRTQISLGMEEGSRMNNRGLIDGVTTKIRGHSLNNLGSGTIYGDHILLGAESLSNNREAVNGDTKALIGARKSLRIGAKTLCSRESALILSGGKMSVGAHLDEKGELTGEMATFKVESATVEVQGYAHFEVAHLHLCDIHFAVESVIRQEGDRRITEPVLASSCRPSKLHVGGDLYLTGKPSIDRSQVVLGGKLVGPIADICVVDEHRTRHITEWRSEYYKESWGNWFNGGSNEGYRRVPYSWQEPVNLRAASVRYNAALPSSEIVVGSVSLITMRDAAGNQMAVQVLSPVANVQQVAVLARCSKQSGAMVVRSSLSPLRLPEVGLFTLQRSGTGPVVVTDPNFRCWEGESSTALLLRKLQLGSIDLARLPRLHGSNLYEQVRIREQVIQVSGRRFLPGFWSDAHQQKALLAAAEEVVIQEEVTPGVPLTLEQQTRITKPTLWPVAKEMPLPDGKSVTVLDPHLYVPMSANAGHGESNALLSAEDFSLQMPGNLTSSGTIIAGGCLQMEAQNVDIHRGTLIAGRTIVGARQDFTNVGGTLAGYQELQVQAGRDLRSRTETHTTEAGTTGRNRAVRTTLGREAAYYAVNPQAKLSLAAGQNATFTATKVGNFGVGGHTDIRAGQDLTTDTVTTGSYDEYVSDADNFYKRSFATDVGSQFSTAGTMGVAVGGDMDCKMLQVRTNLLQDTSDGRVPLEDSREGAAIVTTEDQSVAQPEDRVGLQVDVGGTLTVSPGYSHSFSDTASKYTESGLFSSKTTYTRETQRETLALGSCFSGESIAVGAKNIRIHGSDVVAEKEVTLEGSEVLSMTSAEEEQRDFYFRRVTKSGIFSSGGLSLCIGSQTQKSQQELRGTRQRSSRVGSVRGNVFLKGKQHCYQLGSQVVAPKGKIKVSGKKVDILAAAIRQELTQQSSTTRSGLSVGVTNPLVSAVQMGPQITHALSNSDDPRMQALVGATAGLAVKNTFDALKSNPTQLGGASVNVSFGKSKSESRVRQSQQNSHPSELLAREISISATGRGPKDHLRMQGAKAVAERIIDLKSEQEMQLLADRNCATQESSHSFRSQAFGVAFSSSGGPALTMDVSGGEGAGEGEDISWTTTDLEAGQLLSIQSGSDAFLKGVEGKSEQIRVDVGGNCVMESLQDSSRIDSHSEQWGVNLALSSTMVSGSVNFGEDNLRRRNKSVTKQTALRAGDLGCQYQGKGNLHMKGAIWASSDAAVENNANSVVTGTLTLEEIENEDVFDATSMNVGVGYSKSLGGGKQGAGATPKGKGAASNRPEDVATGGSSAPKPRSGLTASIPIMMKASGEAHSTTGSGISGVGQGTTVIIMDREKQEALTGQSPEQTLARLDGSVRSNKDSSNAVTTIFNEKKIEEDFRNTRMLVRQVGTFLDNRAKEQTQTTDALEQEMRKSPELQNPAKIAQLKEALHENRHWEMGGKGRILMSALALAAGSNVAGGTGQLLQAATVNTLQGLGAREVKKLSDAMGSETARTALHGILAASGAAVQGQDVTTAALAAGASVVLHNLLEAAFGDKSGDLPLEERQARKNLVTALISGTSKAVGGDAALANTAAAIEAENNSSAEVVLGGCAVAGGPICALTVGAAVAGVAVGVLVYKAVDRRRRENSQDYCDAEEVLAGRKTLEQVAIERGDKRGRKVEACVKELLFQHLSKMELQLQPHMTGEDREYLAALHALEDHAHSQRFLQSLQGKYLSSSDGVIPATAYGALVFKRGKNDAKGNTSGALPIPKETTALNGCRIFSGSHTPGCKGFGPHKGIEPRDSLDLFEQSVSIPGHRHRYTYDCNGAIHRFANSGDNTYHWNGCESDEKNPLVLKGPIKAVLQKIFKCKIK